MSGEYEKLIVDDKEKKQGIQQPEETKPKTSQASTSQYTKTRVLPIKDVVGVTEHKQLLDELKDVEIDISDTYDDQEERRNKKYGKIQKVSNVIIGISNEDCQDYFKPKMLSIGPIHAADPDLCKKELKLKLAAHFIKRSERTAESLLENIKNEIEDIKEFFDEDVIKSYTDEKLVELMFLDGCAMLEFIHSYVNQRLNLFNISNGQAALIQQDLFLLENQIPFIVFEALAENLWENNVHLREDLHRFIVLTINVTFPRDSTKSQYKNLGVFCWQCMDYPAPHILDLLRKMLITCTSEHHFKSLLTPAWNFFWRLCCCTGAIPLISHAMERLKKSHELPEDWSRKRSFRSVQELKTTGIKFKPSDSLTTISFHSQCFIAGKLLLPTLIVDNLTARSLLNLVAYETCLPKAEFYRGLEKYEYYFDHDVHKYWVTSYVTLLDLLVDNEQDVKDLRAADILRNSLSTDFEVAKLINTMGSKCFAPPEDTYKDVKNNIERHYRRKGAIWMAEVCHSHFSSPLTIIALVAATTVLALTVVQTWYTVKG